MKLESFYIITLGCPRNYVDTQAIARHYQDRGLTYASDIYSADIVVINTCGFIQPAVKESIDVILDVERLYEQGYVKKVVIHGCLVERYKKELKQEFPFAELRGCIDPRRLPSEETLPVLEGAYAYVKICEGCVKRCSYCTIPFIRGKLKSRRIEDIVAEINRCYSLGKKEIVLVGQDTTAYGIDIYKKPSLLLLLKRIIKDTDIPWIRIMYAYPSLIEEELLDFIAGNKRILPYIDVPIQHINDTILTRMRREYDRALVEQLFEEMDRREIAIRTTVIVGFPGEDRGKFRELTSFLKNSPVARLGVFKFNREKGTPAYSMRPRVKEATATSRYYTIRKIAGDLLLRANERFLRDNFEVIVDGYDTINSVYVGRSVIDAPEVDDIVLFESKDELFTGDIVMLKRMGNGRYKKIDKINEGHI